MALLRMLWKGGRERNTRLSETRPPRRTLTANQLRAKLTTTPVLTQTAGEMSGDQLAQRNTILTVCSRLPQQTYAARSAAQFTTTVSTRHQASAHSLNIHKLTLPLYQRPCPQSGSICLELTASGGRHERVVKATSRGKWRSSSRRTV
jgi:hypothetical protein